MVFSYQRCYLPEAGHICTRPKVDGKCALSRADNSADMKKTRVIIFISLVLFL